MSNGIVTGVISAITVAGGAAITVSSYSTLDAEGAFGPRPGAIDFIVGALLLVGVALLIAGVIIALAALAQFWFDRQDAKDARLAERDLRRAQLGASLPPSVAGARPGRSGRSGRRVAH